MYKRILLALDGSSLAEKAVPHALALAQAFHARVQLLTVVPVVRAEGPAEIAAAVNWDREADEARDYLASLCGEVRAEGLACAAEVTRGEVTEGILRYAADYDADLIVMSTHGRSGLGRWVYGSIADRVLRHAKAPVLLVRAGE